MKKTTYIEVITEALGEELVGISRYTCLRSGRSDAAVRTANGALFPAQCREDRRGRRGNDGLLREG